MGAQEKRSSEPLENLPAHISAFVLTYNEERNIAACLESLTWCDEIVVVDSGSADSTIEIASRYKAKIVQQPWLGYAGQKNVALAQCRGPWILWVDADERITPGLAKEIRACIPTTHYAVYRIPRRLHFLGKRLRFGGVGTDSPFRLFRKEAVSFPETHLIHEKPEVKGPIGRLRAEMDHYSYLTLADYFGKLNGYTSLAARQMHMRKRRFRPHQLLIPLWEFFERIVFRMAFLDGIEGMAFAAFSSYSVLIKYLKLREFDRQDRPR